MRRKYKIISDCVVFKFKEVYVEVFIIYICLLKKFYFLIAELKYFGYFLGELCVLI